MKDDEAKVEFYLFLSGFLIFVQLRFDKLERFLPDKHYYPSLIFPSGTRAFKSGATFIANDSTFLSIN
jgi:hypothetical protein